MEHKRVSSKDLDKFYTLPSVASSLLDDINDYICNHCVGAMKARDIRYLEPSAGAGAFSSRLPGGSVAMDIAPASADIKRADFLQFNSLDPALADYFWVTVGNPPFGKNSSLAVRFFNKAAEFSDVIAFIVPKTFAKASIQNRLDNRFFIKKDVVVPEDAFILDDEKVNVPCVFQIWVKSPTKKRPKIVTSKTHPDFMYVTKDKGDFAFQRVGVNAGAVKTKPYTRNLSPASHHFIRAVDRDKKDVVLEKFRGIDWDNVKHNTAGNPSIAKTEIISCYRLSAGCVSK